ncbi:hypothetical protein COLO4_02806 [Corchorus olitorius]|uniref:Uncharacterized protein n=1 Tax=Corchorus olitorius TaxID=93759 RepID=A0A1R3L0B4_9ROSI|nr:hypothetical protein COLO4_02806 [Corchorus olitorius]
MDSECGSIIQRFQVKEGLLKPLLLSWNPQGNSFHLGDRSCPFRKKHMALILGLPVTGEKIHSQDSQLSHVDRLVQSHDINGKRVEEIENKLDAQSKLLEILIKQFCDRQNREGYMGNGNKEFSFDDASIKTPFDYASNKKPTKMNSDSVQYIGERTAHHYKESMNKAEKNNEGLKKVENKMSEEVQTSDSVTMIYIPPPTHVEKKINGDKGR